MVLNRITRPSNPRVTPLVNTGPNKLPIHLAGFYNGKMPETYLKLTCGDNVIDLTTKDIRRLVSRMEQYKFLITTPSSRNAVRKLLSTEVIQKYRRKKIDRANRLKRRTKKPETEESQYDIYD